MVRFNSVAPTFPVSDVGETIRWYEQHLGFAAHPFPPSPPHAFAIVCRDGVEIMFQRLPGYDKPDLYGARAGGVWDAYLRLKGVRELYEAVKDNLEIKMALRRQPYGDWEFEVRDLNGYILVF